MSFIQNEVDEGTRVAVIAAKLQGQLWVTNDKEKLYPQQMESRHIRNVIKMIVDGRMAKSGRSGCSGFNNAQWLVIFKDELVRREKKND